MLSRMTLAALALAALAGCTHQVTYFVRSVQVEDGAIRVTSCRLDEDGFTAKADVDRATCTTETTALARKAAP